MGAAYERFFCQQQQGKTEATMVVGAVAMVYGVVGYGSTGNNVDETTRNRNLSPSTAHRA